MCSFQETEPKTTSTLLQHIFQTVELNFSSTRPGDGKMHEGLLEIFIQMLAMSENEVSDQSCRIYIQHS